jgi:hypothetical protein
MCQDCSLPGYNAVCSAYLSEVPAVSIISVKVVFRVGRTDKNENHETAYLLRSAVSELRIEPGICRI